jgi:hypothetical protein
MRAHHDAIEAASALGSFGFTVVLVVFTGVLALRTAGLFTETRRLRETADKERGDMLRSVAAAETTANAAMLAIGSERAWITLERAHINTATKGSLNGVPFENALVFQSEWRNRGRRPAIRLECYAEIRFIDFADEEAPAFRPTWGVARLCGRI